MRLLFALHRYDSIMDFKPPKKIENSNLWQLNSMEEAVSKDSRFKEFFLTVSAIMRNNKITAIQKWEKKEFTLHD